MVDNSAGLVMRKLPSIFADLVAISLSKYPAGIVDPCGALLGCEGWKSLWKWHVALRGYHDALGCQRPHLGNGKYAPTA